MPTLTLLSILTSSLGAMIAAVVFPSFRDCDTRDYHAPTIWMSTFVLIHDAVSFPSFSIDRLDPCRQVSGQLNLQTAGEKE